MNDERYGRQVKVIGNDGQKKLKEASVVVIGCGGLGCPISLYMATAGVGKVTIIDNDVVSLSNLHRQVLFGDSDIGMLKVDVAKRQLLKLNPNIEIISVNDRVNVNNVQRYIESHDIVIVGCDNLETRYIVNDACCNMKIQYINASILGDEGSITYFDIDNGCYRCIFPNVPKDKSIPLPDEMGVLGPLVGVIGTITATMAVEVLIGNKSKYINKIFTFDSFTLRMKGYPFSKDVCCLSCSI